MPCPPIFEEFPLGSPVFFLAQKLYGTIAEVVRSDPSSPMTIDLKIMKPVEPSLQKEPSETVAIAKNESANMRYYPGWQLAKRIKISALSLSRLTSTFQISFAGKDQKLNIGLCLKYESKGMKVLGYTRKTEKGWEYSQKAVELIEDYRKNFPSIFKKVDSTGNGDMLKDVDIFGPKPESSIEKLKAWLADKGIKKLLSVPLNSQTLTKVIFNYILTMIGICHVD